MRSLYQSVKMSRAAKRLEMGKKEEGFTLIELMIVVLIIAILVAVAVPTFLGARKSAQRSAAAQLLRSTVQTGRDIYTTNNAFPNSTTSYTSAEPAIAFEGANGTTNPATKSNNYNSVAVAFGSGNNSTGNIQSAEYGVATSGGECLYALDIPSDQSSLIGTASGVKTAGTYYALGTAAKGICTIAQIGAMPAGSTATSWSATPVAS